MKFIKNPVAIEATQWFGNGDHPLDYSRNHDGLENGELRVFTAAERKANGWEGDIVRYFRRPGVSGKQSCKHCGKTMHEHGWIETLEGGHIVCPGDWIITGVQGERYPCKPDIFQMSYRTEEIPPQHMLRVIDEKRELDERREKLGEFKSAPLFERLPWQEQERLNTQAHVMTMLSAVLGARISAAKEQA